MFEGVPINLGKADTQFGYGEACLGLGHSPDSFCSQSVKCTSQLDVRRSDLPGWDAGMDKDMHCNACQTVTPQKEDRPKLFAAKSQKLARCSSLRAHYRNCRDTSALYNNNS
ncbi:hypothetical protein KC367_g264 [Hortaea werneckii]|nr:hypothetical protein KC367_g264 [Hortaea werneckii]